MVLEQDQKKLIETDEKFKIFKGDELLHIGAGLSGLNIPLQQKWKIISDLKEMEPIAIV